MKNYDSTLFVQLFGSFIVTERINKTDINDLLVFIPRLELELELEVTEERTDPRCYL